MGKKKENQERVELRVTGVAPSGAGVAFCRWGDASFRVFVPGALPGDAVEAFVAPPGRGRASSKAEDIAVTKPSPGRRGSPCPFSGVCGGCPMIGLTPAFQASFKENLVRTTLEAAGIREANVEKIVSNGGAGAVRNKSILYFGGGAGSLTLGMYRTGTHSVAPGTMNCPKCPGWMGKAAAALVSWGEREGLAPWDGKAGVLRAVQMREGSRGRLLTIAAAEHPGDASLKRLSSLLVESGVTTAALSLNRSAGNRVLGDAAVPFLGSGRVETDILGLTFEVRSETFLQVNPVMTPVLYRTALGMAGIAPDVTLLDLYCGIGTMTLAAAKTASMAIGVEIVPESVEEARENARRNGVPNAGFHCGAAGAVLPRLAKDGLRPDSVIVDPPRKGLEEGVAECLAHLSPARLVYVACGLEAMARDAARLETLGMKLERAVPVDLFPDTAHVETVALFSRGSSGAKSEG